jgi:diguanylate cyclase (GGDEF)-like protein
MINKYLRSMNISKKLGVVFLILVSMIFVGGGVGLYNATEISRVTKFIYLDSYANTTIFYNIEREFMAQRQELLMHIMVTDEGSKAFLSSTIDEHTEKIVQALDELESYDHKVDIVEEIKLFRGILPGYWDLQSRIVRLCMSGEQEAAVRLVEGVGAREFNTVLNALKKLLDAEEASSDVTFRESVKLARTITLMTFIFTVLAIIIAVAFWLILTRAIVKPILLIAESAKSMAGGDLRRRAPVLSGDEIGDLAAEFNKMAESIEEYYITLEGRVEERTDELRVANEELNFNKVKLEEKNEELSRASRMKSQFLANVSHELRTPLNSIIGFSELLQEKSFGELNEKQSQYVAFIHTSGGHLLQLINSILDLSKIEAGRMELQLEEVSLSGMLADTLGTIRPLALKRSIIVESRSTHASPIILVDKGKFKQILINLLSNAVKFNVDGGRVDVDWDIIEEFEGMDMKRFLRLSVKDTGEGISESDIQRLFREFEQLDTSVTREQGGTGLGLALTKRLVELHGGTIKVESVLGEGTKFTVLIPIPQDSVRTEVAVMAESSVPAKTTKSFAAEAVKNPLILIAGESANITQLLEIYLGGENYDVVSAVNGEDLLRKAGELKPFAIVTGIALDKKDGWEVLRELKDSEETSQIPVVIVSSSNNKDLGFALGAVDYLEKPVDRERLLSTLKRMSFSRKSRGDTLNILVVDDEPHVLSLLGDILEKEGFGVFKALGGKEGIRIAVHDCPDLIILDLMMPEVSGFNVVEKLKESPVTRNIPVMIFTAKDITDEDKDKLGNDIKKIIQKAGFNKDDLLSEIRLLELTYPDRANMIDPVTRLFNRRYFDIMLIREVSRNKRYGQVLSMLFIDIDDFNAFNEKHGRSTADNALSDIAAIITADIRKADSVMRFGPDEFAVFLPGINEMEAIGVARKLRSAIEVHGFLVPKGKDNLTVSIAAVAFSADMHGSVVELLEGAVKKLYDTGGNDVVVCKGKAD